MSALLPVVDAPLDEPSLRINPALTASWLEAFLRDELVDRLRPQRRKANHDVVGEDVLQRDVAFAGHAFAQLRELVEDAELAPPKPRIAGDAQI